MSGTRPSRIVVWLDPTTLREDSLHVLTGFGSATEVLGLFIEDMTLLEVSRLPVAREIAFEQPVVRQMDRLNVERQFRVNGARMRRLFESAANRIKAHHTFRVARGELGAELLKVSTGCDTLVLSHTRRRLGQRLGLRARLGELLTNGPPILVFIQEQWRTGHGIAVLFGHGPQGKAALRTAADIAITEGLALSVWLPSGAPDERQRITEQVADTLGDSLVYSVRLLDGHTADDLVQAAGTENPRVLVLPCTEPAETHQLVVELLERAACSLIVTR